MRSVFFSAAIIASVLARGQSNLDDQIQAMQTRQTQLEKVSKQYQDSINIVKSKIQELQRKKFLNNTNGFKTAVKYETRVADGPDRNNFIGTFPLGDSVSILGEEWSQLLATDGTITGYIGASNVVNSSDLQAYLKVISEKQEKEKQKEQMEKAEKQNEANAAAQRKRAEERAAVEKKRADDIRAALLARYGEETTEKVIERKIWVGMTGEMASYSLGKPLKINTSVGSNTTNEQWIYPDETYLYFENGILTNYQYSK